MRTASQRGFNGSYGCIVDQRAHQRVRVQRVADTNLAIGFDQGVLDLIEARTVRDDATRRRTALPGRADRAEYDRRNGKIEVGVFVDDDGVVAAEFEQAFAQAICKPFTDAAADPGRAREGDQVDALVVNEALREFMRTRAAIDQEEHGRQIHAFKRLVDDLLHGHCTQRRAV